MRLSGLGWLIVAGVILFPWSEAWAIPAWSRDLERPCAMCHIAFPKLEPFGMIFKQNGYRLTTDQGRYIWEAKYLPIAGFVLLKYVNKAVEDNETGDTLEEEGRFELDEVEFFSGGPLSRRFSYFVDLESEEGEPLEPGAAFLTVNDLLPDAQLNLKIGRMDNEFFYLSSMRRLTLVGYLAPVRLENTGIEANGFVPFGDAGLRYAVGFGNDEVDEVEADNNVRAGYAWATYTVRDQTIGVRYYSAKADTCTEPDPTNGCLKADEQNHTQIEGNLDLYFEPLNLILAYYKQDNVDGVKDKEQKNLLAELLYLPVSQVALSARYEMQDDPDTDGKDTQYILSAAYYPIANVRFVGEYSNLIGDEVGKDEQRFQLAAHLGF